VEKEHHLHPPEGRYQPWWRCCERKTKEWDCPASGEQNQPTGCPSPQSGNPQKRRREEKVPHPQNPRAEACRGVGADSPGPRKKTPPEQPGRQPAVAVKPWPNDKVEIIRNEKIRDQPNLGRHKRSCYNLEYQKMTNLPQHGS